MGRRIWHLDGLNRRPAISVTAWLAAAVISSSALGADEALKACSPDDAAWVDVHGPDPNGIFKSATGLRFYLTDVSMTIGDASDAIGLRRVLDADRETPGKAEEVQFGSVQAVAVGPPNRWGLTPAWFRSRQGAGAVSLQGRLLENGLAVFLPRHAQGACAVSLRRHEMFARLDGKGIWADAETAPVYWAHPPDNVLPAAGRPAIVRGRVVSLGKTRSTRYLNFGHFWKEDFTVTVESKDVVALNAALGKSGWALEALAGQVVEVRGVVEVRDGPHIAVLHPEQLTVLDD